MSETEQIEALVNEIAALRAQADEDGALITHLRQRTVTLNHEVRIRDAWISERDRKLAEVTGRVSELTERIAGLTAK